MIYINKQLKKDYVYNSFKEMYPHLDERTDRQNGFYAEFSEDSKSIFIETTITDGKELQKRLEKWLDRVREITEKALIDYQKSVDRCNERINTIKKVYK